MKTTKNCLLPLVAFCAAFVALPAQAVNTLYAPGDLILYFQQEGGANTIYANLGAAYTYRGAASGIEDATRSLGILELGTTLTTAFGAGWASDPSIYAGLAGVASTGTLSGVATNGDPQRTVYVSDSRESVGVGSPNSGGYTLGSTGGSSSASGGILTMNTPFANLNTSTDIAIVGTASSNIDKQNPFLAPGLQGTAFSTFGGGVQQQGTAGTRGTELGIGDVEFALDLHRILARTSTTPGFVTGPVLSSTLEGTVVVGTDGAVSFIGVSAIPEPSGVLALGLIGTFAGLGYRRRKA